MKAKDRRILKRLERKIEKRLRRDNYPDSDGPVMDVPNIHYEMSEKTRAIGCGAIGAFHDLCDRTGLVDSINEKVHVLKRHLPYHESDHVLNLAYNTLTDGKCLQDIKNNRNSEAFLDALGAERIPDSTTAGDFCRRFEEQDVDDLMEAINAIRLDVWRMTIPKCERDLAIIDVDGKIAETTGECKDGMDISYNGIWGYHPLLVSLRNTVEPLYLVNRSGNRPSHDGSIPWIDRATELTSKVFRNIVLCGDTDFSLTENFDRWTDSSVGFCFGYDAKENLVRKAEQLCERQWNPLVRRQKRPPAGKSRAKPANVKERIVEERGFTKKLLIEEHIAEFPYRPTKCKKDYRMVVLRKKVRITEGQKHLFDDIVYFFYVTNLQKRSADEVLFLNNDRCNQENLLKELANGLNAMRMPEGDLVSNWAYMVMTSLAWTLKAWFALHVWLRDDRKKLLKMGFRQFLNTVIRIPCQIIKGARQVRFRMLGWTEWTGTFLNTFERLRAMSYG